MSTETTNNCSPLQMAYRRLSLRKKLVLIITSVASLLTIASMLVSFFIELNFFKSRLLEEYQVDSEIFATNLDVALVFEDPYDANDILSTLTHKAHIINGALYYKNGELLANYRHKDLDTDYPIPPHDVATGINKESLIVNQPVIHEGREIGNFILEANLDEMSSFLVARLWIFATLVVVSLALATYLAYRLGDRVSKPIIELSKTAQRITEDHDVSTRQERISDDETGQLVDAFNEMMDEVEKREAALLAAKETAEASSRAKDDFLSVISHELRTPLNPIIGYVEILQQRITDADDNRKLALVRQYSEHLQDLIDRVIDFTRFERGDVNLNNDPVDFQSLCQNVARLLEKQAADKGLEISYDHIKSDLDETFASSRILTDRVKLQQVVLNLVANAIKFTPSGSVRLRSKLKESSGTDATLRIEVEDTGIGIRKEDAERIFLPFSQIDPSLTRQYSGMGLGLAITQRIITAMDGVIDLSSEKDRGSTFWFEIPVSFTSDSDPLEADPLTPAASEKKCRVLLVDDQLVNLELGESMLASCGHEVVTARSGIDALEIAKEEVFDLIILDIKMPKMNGYQTAIELRKLEKDGMRTPIIAMTAHVTTRDSAQCFEAGMDDFLPKPFNTQRLNEITRKWLG